MSNNTKFTGAISACQHVKDSGTGWKKWNVTFSGESEARKVDIPPDAEYTPKVGDTITVWSGKFNSWTLDKSSLPSGNAAPAESGGSASPASGGGHSKADAKFRDPDVIELEGYFRIVADLFIASLPGFEGDSIPKDMDQFDGAVDMVFAKAKALQLAEKASR